MTIQANRNELLSLVDVKEATIDRRIFSDADIYQLELERIFARAWNFVAHDSQIPNPGDFFMTFIGEDRVIVVRDNDMQPQVLVNSCRHRGNAVCRAEEGHATSFMCTYHGWTYDLKGNLVGVPGFKEVYHEELDREHWGLIKAAHVETYQGFVFATMDEAAPPLEEFLGEIGKLSINMLAGRGPLRVVPGIQKSILPCNWKFAVDNVWDFYHPSISHASQTMAAWRPGPQPNQFKLPQIALLGEYGHALSGPQYNDQIKTMMQLGLGHDTDWRQTEEGQAMLGAVGNKAIAHPHVFPNLWMAFPGHGQLSLRLPRGPLQTEIWWFSFEDVDTTPEKHAIARQRAGHSFGPAGMLEQDDGENWGESTRGSMGVISSKYRLHYGMAKGHGEVIKDESGPPRIEHSLNEFAQMWHYQAWAEWMAAESWEDLRANHTKEPEGFR
jgi:phenylpropionate dioxygenase-like ring-hydroxylating dioxygenase large terminal subunit